MARAQQTATTSRNHDETDSDSVAVVATSSAKKAKSASSGGAAATGGKGSKKQENGKTAASSTSTSKAATPSSKPRAVKSKEPSFDSDSECPACAAIPREKRKKSGKSPEAEDWIACDECERWFHFRCLRDKTWTPNELVEYYCPECIKRSQDDPDREEPLAIKLREAPRKSSRKKAEVSYQSSTHKAGAPNPWHAVAESRPLTTGAFPTMQARQVTVQWLESDPKAFTEPIFIPRPEGLDMLVLPADIRISEIAAAVGPDKPLDVIDVASQSGLSNWTVGKWASYFEDPGREKVRNVISLELSATPMKDKVASPKVVRDIDWVEQFWPRDLMAKDIYPQVIRYCLMSPALSWTDWHIDFSASSVFYHILRGSKTFYFIRPTASNLAKYEKWSGTSQQLGVWLGDECDEVHKVELQAGNTLIIPSGWIHCVYTPTDALVIGGNFLHSYNIATQLRVYQIELATKVPKKFRFPYFVTLLWYVGHHYHRQLSKSRHGVCERILKGLKALSAFLIEQAWRMTEEADVSAERRKVANENVPWQVVDDPEALAADLQKAVYKALGEDLPSIPLDGKPNFDARDFLDADRLPPSSNGKLPNGKRKAGSVTPSEAPAAKSARLRHLEQNGNGKAKASGGHSEVRTTTAPTTVSTAEVRKRPLDLTIDFDESTPKPEDERILQTAEVKTTTSETVLVKTLPGPEEGSWIVETRKVVNTIERVYFPPLPASGPSSHREASMDIDQKTDSSSTVKTEPSDSPVTAHPVMNGAPLDEISRLLSMATVPRTSSKPPQELLDALASLPATTM